MDINTSTGNNTMANTNTTANTTANTTTNTTNSLNQIVRKLVFVDLTIYNFIILRIENCDYVDGTNKMIFNCLNFIQ